MSATPKQVLLQLERLEPGLRNAFLAAVRQIADDATIKSIAALLAGGEYERVVRALGLDAATLSEFLEEVRRTYLAGGTFEARQVPALRTQAGDRFVLRFDVRNERAEAWLAERSSTFVTEITEDTRAAVRQAVESGTRLGRNPRDTALDLVGRIDATGRRTGGLVGLTNQQAEFVTNAREQLLSGDPAKMAKYFERKARDQRFDKLVRRYIDAGKSVPVADVERIAARYADRLLFLRGETIARTEALAGFNAARHETYSQLIDNGVQAHNITKRWSTAGGDRVRDTHAAMHGQSRPFAQPFRSPSGALLMFPGDSSLGAPASEVINCRCNAVMKVDHLAEVLGA